MSVGVVSDRHKSYIFNNCKLIIRAEEKKEGPMAKIAIIGAGFAGHTAALYLGVQLGKKHDVTMINKQDYFLYVPSLIWVGVGHMKEDKVRFPLKPV